MKKYTLLIADDEPAARDGLKLLLQQDPEIEIVAVCKNGEEAIEAIRNNAPQLVLLDIQMPGLTGLEVLRSLEKDQRIAFAFITAHNSFAVQAFEDQAADYLLKPFTNIRFESCINKLKRLVDQQQLISVNNAIQLLSPYYLSATQHTQNPVLDKLPIKVNGVIKLIEIKDIYAIEGFDYYVKVKCTNNKEYIMRESLKNIETTLRPNGFLRIHKSTLVNLKKVSEIENFFNGTLSIKLEDNQILKVSKSYRDIFLKRVAAI